MYDELVKRLREPCPYENCVLCQQAADAIEELSRENESLAKSVIEASEILRKRWIPVTERLPEENAPCIVYNKDYGPMVGCRVDGERFRIPGSRFPDHPTHWMPLPEPPKEE